MVPGDGLSSKTVRKDSRVLSQSDKATGGNLSPSSQILVKMEPQNVKLVRKYSLRRSWRRCGCCVEYSNHTGESHIIIPNLCL